MHFLAQRSWSRTRGVGCLKIPPPSEFIIVYLSSNKTPLSLINFLVRINRFVPLEALDGKSYSIRLRGTNTIIHLPPLRSLQQWQFSQSYRWHDPFFTELIRTALKNFSAKIFFDIGANQGLRSLDPLSQGCNVIAFEPNEIAIDFLRQIIALNPVLKQQECRIIVAAVGDQAGQVEFEIELELLPFVCKIDPETFRVPARENHPSELHKNG